MHKKLESINNNLRVILEEDAVGWYLIVFQKNSKKSSEDYLFDSMEDALDEAEERFGIPKGNWHEMPKNDKSNPIDELR